MTDQGDGQGRWDAADLARVHPTSTSHDVEPQVREPLGSGVAGGVGQYTPIGELNQTVSFASDVVHRVGWPGRVAVGLVVVSVVLFGVVIPLLGMLTG